MNEDTSNSQNKDFSTDTNLSQNEASGTENKIRDKLPGGPELKEYGKKSLAPLIDLVGKYKGEIFPYFDAIGRGLQGAVNAFGSNSNTTGTTYENVALDEEQGKEFSTSEADQAVSGWFREAAEWFEGANQRIKSGNADDLLDYLETQAQRHPAMMFSSSYIAGLVFGRIGRHIGRQFAKGSTGSLDTASSGDQNYSSDPMKH